MDGEPLSGCATSLNLLFIIIICYYFFFLLFYKTFLNNKHIALDTDVFYLFHYVFYYKAVPEFQEKEQVPVW